MRFLMDECTGSKVAKWLRDENHEVFSVFDEARGIMDNEVSAKTFSKNWFRIYVYNPHLPNQTDLS